MQDWSPLRWKARLAALGAGMAAVVVAVYTGFVKWPLPGLGKGVSVLILLFFSLVGWLQILAIFDIVTHWGVCGKDGETGDGS